MLSKEGTDIFVVGESRYSFMKDYKPPAAALYLFDMKKANLIGLKDWVAAQPTFKLREDWQTKFQ
jgi:hypothetical protein